MKKLSLIILILSLVGLIPGKNFSYEAEAMPGVVGELENRDDGFLKSGFVEYEPRKEGVRAVITAYSKHETCPRNDCKTASGVKPYVGSVACPRSQNLGSQVLIGGELYTCEDRTSLKYDGRYDIWMESYEEAIKFGKQNLEVILK